MRYAKELKKLLKKERKLDALCRKLALRIMHKFPEWYIGCTYKKRMVHKKGAIFAERHEIAIQKTYSFEFDMRDNWKKSVKEAFKTVEDHIARCR